MKVHQSCMASFAVCLILFQTAMANGADFTEMRLNDRVLVLLHSPWAETLTVVDVQPEDMVQALQSGKVDAISVWQPYGYLALKAMGAVSVRKMEGEEETVHFPLPKGLK